MRIDLNCDLGECEELAVVFQPQLLECVTSANVACGAHAGSAALMELTVQQAVEHGVAIGAHPGYADRVNFGRVELAISDSKLEDSIAQQVERLLAIAARVGAHVTYVKPHGALYNRAARDRATAEAIARATARVDSSLALMGFAGSVMIDAWRERGFTVVAEAFADRAYESNGLLRSRALPGAMLTVEESAAQSVLIATHSPAFPLTARCDVDTICLHGDADSAVERARAVRAALTAAGVEICSWQSGRAPR